MNYALLLITHGDAPALDETLRSFRRHVTPQPTRWHAVVDGAYSRLPPMDGGEGDLNDARIVWSVTQHQRQKGFGAACHTAWRLSLIHI